MAKYKNAENSNRIKNAANNQIKKTSNLKSKPAVAKNNSYSNNLEKIKIEAAQEVGVKLKNSDNGNLTAREAGSIGGQMVKKMIESYKKNLK